MPAAETFAASVRARYIHVTRLIRLVHWHRPASGCHAPGKPANHQPDHPAGCPAAAANHPAAAVVAQHHVPAPSLQLPPPAPASTQPSLNGIGALPSPLNPGNSQVPGHPASVPPAALESQPQPHLLPPPVTAKTTH